MKDVNVPVGVADFRKVREGNYYYIDKTGLIEEILRTPGTEVTLITRPRRFGKSLGMSMLAHFFDIREDSRKLFAGLKISENKELCEQWMNQYPVVLVSLKSVDGLNFDSAYAQVSYVMAELYKKYLDFMDSEKINSFDKELFSEIAAGKASPEAIKNSLYKLTQLLSIYYGKSVILLIDEYDVPVAKANANGYYEQMLDMIRGILSTALKDNTFLNFSVVTGCLRITKESIFTGLNNFTTDTISDRRYEEYFGFTHDEVKALLRDTELEERFELIQKWYDGYHFGDMDIFCPWDLLNYVNKAMTQGTVKPESFWENTSGNIIIRQFLERTEYDVTEI